MALKLWILLAACLLLQTGSWGAATAACPAAAPVCAAAASLESACCCCPTVSAQEHGGCSCTEAPAPGEEPHPFAPWTGSLGRDLLHSPAWIDLRANPGPRRSARSDCARILISRTAGRDISRKVALSVRFCTFLI